MLPPPNPEAGKGQWVFVVAVNPASVCGEEALFVAAARSVGVLLHPFFPFAIETEEIDGKPATAWRWVLAAQSKDGAYKTAELQKWWNDPAWAKANPKHEFALVMAVVRNVGVQAAEVRATIPRAIVRKGNTAAYIPANASPARREFLLAKLEGRIPLNAVFTEPAPAS